jgi:hypothetical protein
VEFFFFKELSNRATTPPLSGGTEESYGKPDKMAGVLTEIRTEHFRDASLKRCLYTNLFGGKGCVNDTRKL